jgi:hypothetical protein
MTEKQLKDITFEDIKTMTINNIPVTELTDLGKQVFVKIYKLQLECKQLQAIVEKKTAAVDELVEILKPELESLTNKG